MGKHYRADVTGGPIGFLKALYRNMHVCQWVETLPGMEGEKAGVYFFRNRNGANLPPKVLKASN
jgi:omega-6 fatty acid desaturase / acyl-lipid omega-6 desaturase (Delta-12 desaturase)